VATSSFVIALVALALAGRSLDGVQIFAPGLLAAGGVGNLLDRIAKGSHCQSLMREAPGAQSSISSARRGLLAAHLGGPDREQGTAHEEEGQPPEVVSDGEILIL
jgi:hypothetical protein